LYSFLHEGIVKDAKVMCLLLRVHRQRIQLDLDSDAGVTAIRVLTQVDIVAMIALLANHLGQNEADARISIRRRRRIRRSR